MSEDYQLNDSEFEAPVSLLFECNLFRKLSSNGMAQCTLCKKQGQIKYVKGRTASSYCLHMKRAHPKEYEQFLAVKQTGVPRMLASFDEDPSDDEYEAHMAPTSPLFGGGFFEICMRMENNSIKANCLVCQRMGRTKFIQARLGISSNLLTHLRRMHVAEYEQYLSLKAAKKQSTPLFSRATLKAQQPVASTIQKFTYRSDDENDAQFPRSSPLFEHGFFEIAMRLENRTIKASCMACQRMGRPNLIQARADISSNLLTHLKRMHIAEYERYLSLKNGQESSAPSAFHPESDIQQSVESTIKSEDLEFVEVNQDEMLDDTWDSFDSSEFYEESDHPQTRHEWNSTSTTRTDRSTHDNTDKEFEAHQLITVAMPTNDEVNEWYESNRKPVPLLFRGGFFRFLKRDGVSVRAECLYCKHGNVYSGHMWTNSNFFKHLSRMHPGDYERYLVMKEEEKLNKRQHRQSQYKSDFQQSDFNRIVLTFMISGMHDINLLEDPSFETLLNDVAAKRTASEPSRKDYHVISPQVLMAEISEQLSTHKEQLLAKLKDVPSISMAIDVWSVNHKTFMLTVVNWVNSVDFNRVSDVLCCDVYPDSISNESLVQRFQRACSYYEISKKIVATVTNNNLHTGRSKQIDEVTFRQLDGIDNHIKNSTHLFEMIGSEDAVNALSDKAYEVLHKTTFGKFEALRDVMESGHLSGKPESILDGVFNQPQIGSKVTETYNSVSNLVNCDCETLHEICTELGILTFDDNDMIFLREYAVIMKPIATAIEYLQNSQCYYATLLPMVYSMKDNLMTVKSQGNIQLCQSLLITVLDAVEQKFHYLFDFNNEQCIPALVATCTHPFFKMRWLKGRMKTPTNTNQILDLLVRVAKEYDDGTKQESEEQQIACSDEQEPPEKKFKFSFDTSDEEANDETIIQMDFMSFLKKPCHNDANNLDELKQHPWVQKLFIRYNSIVSSAAALERSIPLQDLIVKSGEQFLNQETMIVTTISNYKISD